MTLARRILAHIEMGTLDDPETDVLACPDVGERSAALGTYRRSLETPDAWVERACLDCVRDGAPEETHEAWHTLVSVFGSAAESWMVDALRDVTRTEDPHAWVDLNDARTHVGLEPMDAPESVLRRMHDAMLVRAYRAGVEAAVCFMTPHAQDMIAPGAERRREVALLGLMGEGSGGRVYLAAGGDRAVKVATDLGHPQMIMRERNVLMMLRHDHIVRGFSAWIGASGEPHMEMELARYGTLADYAPQGGMFGWVGKQLLSAVDYLASMGIVHGDIRIPNVLVFGPMRIKLCDFELAMNANTATDESWYDLAVDEPSSCDYPPEMYGGCGVPESPHKIDWWGVGHIMFGIAKGSWDADPYPLDVMRAVCSAHGEWVAPEGLGWTEDSDERVRAAYDMMHLMVEERSDGWMRELVMREYQDSARPLQDLVERVTKKREEEDDGTDGKRQKLVPLRREVFEYWDMCDDSAYVHDPRCAQELRMRL